MCIGQELLPDYDLTIERFMELYRNLDTPLGDHFSVTPKLHILEVHVLDFLERQKSLGNGDKGLGWYAEQASEHVQKSQSVCHFVPVPILVK